MNLDKNRVKRSAAAVLAAALLLSGCSAPAEVSEEPALEYETGTLTMGTGEESGMVHLAGAAVAAVINNTVPGIHVALEPSKGAMINATNVSEGDIELALISADVAYDAMNGKNGFEGEALENLRVLGACYQEVSGWIALESSGLSQVDELKGKIISSGTKASATELASNAVYAVLGIDETNTETYFDSLSSSVRHVKEQTADAAHAFAPVPNGAHESLAVEMETVILSYSDELLNEILASEPRYFKTEIPAGTYTGQEDVVPTFGVKVLLCANETMDEDLAYEIARAMDLNGPTYTGGHKFMAAMQEKEFLCNELPIPLHEGAAEYYKELGYLHE